MDNEKPPDVVRVRFLQSVCEFLKYNQQCQSYGSRQHAPGNQ